MKKIIEENMESTSSAFELIMAMFEEIKLEKDNKAGKAKNRKRLQQIKSLVTQAKKDLM